MGWAAAYRNIPIWVPLTGEQEQYDKSDNFTKEQELSPLSNHHQIHDSEQSVLFSTTFKDKYSYHD